jgi:hypothetical protein
MPVFGHGRSPYACFTAGSWGCTAGPNGLVVGCFGWVNPANQEVSNQQNSGILGFVIPGPWMFGPWGWSIAFVQPPPYAWYPPAFVPGGYSTPIQPQENPPEYSQLVVRPGQGVIIQVAGDVKARFPLGAQAGNQVWTDPGSGLPYTSNVTGGYVETPWTAVQNGGCNALVRMTTTIN